MTQSPKLLKVFTNENNLGISDFYTYFLNRVKSLVLHCYGS